MYLDLVISQVQTALVVLKILGILDRSWWLVFLPSIIWVVIGIIVAAQKGRDSA